MFSMGIDAQKKPATIILQLVARISAAGFAAGLIIAAIAFRNNLMRLATYGFFGVFAACAAANATVFLPAPSTAVVFSFAHVYSPFWVAVAGGLGASAGELVGYLAGFSGRRVIPLEGRRRLIAKWMDKHGVLIIFIFAFLPLPLFDFVGVTAGFTEMRFFRFLAPTVAGKLLKMLIYAYLGSTLLPALEPHIKELLAPL